MSKESENQTKPTHHFGRGGAGNTIVKDPKSPSLPPSTTPTLKGQPHYTTGRGGTGNMAKFNADRPEEARIAQDVDIPGVLLSEGPHLTGRGGAANVYNPTDEEIRAAKVNNEEVRRSSFHNKGLRGIVDKGKELFKSNSSAKDVAVE